MIGEKKLSTIRRELRAALVKGRVNPLISLDQEIRRLQRNPGSARNRPRSLQLLRNALQGLVVPQMQKPQRAKEARRVRRAV
jgi:hypothetical protein